MSDQHPSTDQQPKTASGAVEIPEAWQHALDDLWGCIGKREMEHLQPETVQLAKENHEALWHNHDGPVCYADGLPWWHPHHFATVKSPNE
jgi:hypothetical protein